MMSGLLNAVQRSTQQRSRPTSSSGAVAASAPSPGLKRMYEAFRLKPSEQDALTEKFGILDYEDLWRKKQCLELQKFDDVPANKQTRLASFLTFTESQGLETDAQLMDKFPLEDYYDHLAHQHVGISKNALQTVDVHHRYVGTSIHEKTGKKGLPDLAERDRPKLREMIVEDVMENYLSPEMRSKQWCLPYLQRLTDTMLATEGDGREERFVLFGKTQSGKTCFKAVMSALAAVLKAPLVITTKGVPECRELASKLKGFDQKYPDRIVSISGMSMKQLESECLKYLHKGLVLVAADTGAQIKKLRELLEYIWEYEASEGMRRKFIYIVDEADAMYRTKHSTQKVEQQFALLMDMCPTVSIMVTATPVPVYLALHEENKSFQTLQIDAHHDYLGLEDIQVFKHGNEAQFLSLAELKHNEGHIPFTNKQTYMLCDDATSGGKGNLLIFIANPRVYAENNVFTMAEKSKCYISVGRCSSDGFAAYLFNVFSLFYLLHRTRALR